MRELFTTLAQKNVSNARLIEELWSEINSAYSEPGRHYHNHGHIKYLLGKAEEYRSDLEDYDLVLYAIFYHDIVYDFKRKDNEEKSAELGVRRLKQLGLPAERIKRCEKHILATKKHEASDDNDTNYMVDFDLASLGEAPEVFERNAENIRREYSFVPDKEFGEGRKQMLQHFLDMERIFKTKAFFLRYEAQARANLRAAMEKL